MITVGFGFFTTFHIIGRQQNETENNQDSFLPCQDDKIPFSLYFLSFLLTLVSVFPYIKNTALRLFAVKFVKQQTLSLRYETKKMFYKDLLHYYNIVVFRDSVLNICKGSQSSQTRKFSLPSRKLFERRKSKINKNIDDTETNTKLSNILIENDIEVFSLENVKTTEITSL